jgi:hypothetical protein
VLGALRRWRDEIGDTHVLGAVRVAFGVLLFLNALRAAAELRAFYFGDVFHWPLLPEPLVVPGGVYTAIVIAELLLSALVVAGHRARAALFASALLGLYVLGCDRLQFHHNRAALFLYALLLALTPCDLAFTVTPSVGSSAGPLWAARLAQLQLSIIYVASGGSKLLDPDWRGGRVLMQRAVLFGQRAIDRGVPDWLVHGLAQPDLASVLAKVAIATELGLAVALWSRRTRAGALWWGVWFHLVIEMSSRVEEFTWITLAVYALFSTHDARARKLYYDPGRRSGRLVARLAMLLDWLTRFEVKPWAPDDLQKGHRLVVVRRDGTTATGLAAIAMLARCLPLLFPLWAPLALAATFTRGGETSARS